jgi:hypothetical protein
MSFYNIFGDFNKSGIEGFAETDKKSDDKESDDKSDLFKKDGLSLVGDLQIGGRIYANEFFLANGEKMKNVPVLPGNFSIKDHNIGLDTKKPKAKLHVKGDTEGYKSLLHLNPKKPVEDDNIYTFSFGDGSKEDNGKYYTGMGLVPKKRAHHDKSKNALGIHVKNDSEATIYSNGWKKLLSVEGDTGNTYTKGDVNTGSATLRGSKGQFRADGEDKDMLKRREYLRFVKTDGNNDGARFYAEGGSNKGKLVLGVQDDTSSHDQFVIRGEHHANSKKNKDIATFRGDGVTKLGDTLSVHPRVLKFNGIDFKMWDNVRGGKGKSPGRALVHLGKGNKKSSRIILNYGNDFPGGAEVHSKLKVRDDINTGAVTLTGTEGQFGVSGNNKKYLKRREYLRFARTDGATDGARMYAEGGSNKGKLVLGIQDDVSNSDAFIIRGEKHNNNKKNRDVAYFASNGRVGINGIKKPARALHANGTVRSSGKKNEHTDLTFYGIEMGRSFSYLRPNDNGGKTLNIGYPSKRWGNIRNYYKNEFKVSKDKKTALLIDKDRKVVAPKGFHVARKNNGTKDGIGMRQGDKKHILEIFSDKDINFVESDTNKKKISMDVNSGKFCIGQTCIDENNLKAVKYLSEKDGRVHINKGVDIYSGGKHVPLNLKNNSKSWNYIQHFNEKGKGRQGYIGFLNKSFKRS